LRKLGIVILSFIVWGVIGGALFLYFRNLITKSSNTARDWTTIIVIYLIVFGSYLWHICLKRIGFASGGKAVALNFEL